MDLKTFDEEIFSSIEKEARRQQDHIELIASENFVSEAVLEAQGSILTNKYAEGYPGKRYYHGCEYVDEIEILAIKRLTKLFGCKYANVQPHAGSPANLAVYQALLKPGARILGMSLDAGGHLTHGYKLSASGQIYDAYFYGVDKLTEEIDYQDVLRIAKETRPQLIIAGASAYTKIIDFKKFREIADVVGAYLLVDMAHIAGLVAGGMHPSPFPYAHVVTSTTHKTLRGPRGGIVLTDDEDVIKKVNRSVFPGLQGGPLMHVIAAKAVAFKEALQPEFKRYAKQVVQNAKAMAEALTSKGYRLVSGGTDNHIVLVDVKSKLGLTGAQCADILDSVNITCNKNSIPFDTEKPAYTSGIRLGTAAITTKGMKEADVYNLVDLIDSAFLNYKDKNKLEEIKQNVIKLALKFN